MTHIETLTVIADALRRLAAMQDEKDTAKRAALLTDVRASVAVLEDEIRSHRRTREIEDKIRDDERHDRRAALEWRCPWEDDGN
jgi:hypothetical protein